MKRETVVIKDKDIIHMIAWEHCYWNDEDDTCIYEEVDSEVTYQNMDKSYYNETIILKRVADGKYFKAEQVLKSHYHDNDEITLVEVFPKKKTITVYE